MDATPIREADTHCPYCALQCGMLLRQHPDGQIEVLPRSAPAPTPLRPDPPVTGLCQKGWTAAQLLNHPERLTTPLIRDRRDAPLRPVSWEEALDTVATRLRGLRRSFGADAVAVFGGGGLTNEKAYALGKFARVALGTRFIDYNGRFCMSAAATAGSRAFGIDRGLPFPLADLRRAGTLMLVGANPAETMPPLARYLAEQRGAGGTQIVVDPRASLTARAATVHLQPTPGTDLALANGLLHIVIREGWLDTPYITARTRGFERVRATVAGYWPARVERLTGVPAADLEACARALATADRAIIVTARGAEQHRGGVDTVSAWINLALALGLPGRTGSGYGTITGQGNGQGGREHGQKADQLPGYRRIDDPAARAHVAAVWGVDADDLPGPGVSAYELLDRLGGRRGGPRALLVFGSNPVVSAPRAARVESRLRDLDLLVVADFLGSETAQLADVVLPVAQWAEEDGTMTNLEGRVLRRRALREPPPGVRTDLAVLAELALRLGQPAERFPSSPGLVFDELRRATAGSVADYAGVSWQRIDAEDGVFWPCPTSRHPGTARLFGESFATADGRARFTPVEQGDPVEPVSARFPFYLSTGRVLAHYQSGAQTRRVAALAAATPQAFVEIHPDAAARLGIADGDEVTVTSRRGQMRAPARLTDTIRPDTVFAPFHWGGAARVNTVTSDALDPTAGMPQFKVCAVKVERAP